MPSKFDHSALLWMQTPNSVHNLTSQRNSCVGAGMVGYSQAFESHPELSPAEYEAILPSNQAMFNRSDYTDTAPKYNTSSWIPQVGIVFC